MQVVQNKNQETQLVVRNDEPVICLGERQGQVFDR